MVDLTQFKPQIDAEITRQKELRYNQNQCEDPRTAFAEELRSLGFNPPKSITPNIIQRFEGPDDKRGQYSAWCIYFEIPQHGNDGGSIGIGTYGNYKGYPEKETWTSKKIGVMSASEKIDYYDKIKVAQEQRDNEIKLRHEDHAKKAFDIWSNLQPAGDQPYLKSKGIDASSGVRVRYSEYPCGEVVIPITLDNQIMSLQFILNEGEYVVKGNPIGNKKMMSGGRKKGCYFKIEGKEDSVGIAEGYATAKTVHDATGDTVYVCFDSGNLYEVASTAKKENPNAKIVIYGDDDQFNKENAGRNKAMQSADGLGIDCVFPKFKDLTTKPTDFNDLYLLEGIDEVKNQVNIRHDLYKPKKKQELNIDTSIDIFNPVGVLGDIVDYYHATAGNRQMGFAVQTAIATTSVVCSRNFETNFANRSSVFLMNIATSGTGKEHAKKTMEKILDSANMGHLISGDGYTSGSAVISALHERPRHVTVIDEFSKYLQASQSKGSSHLMEANTQLMQAIGRLDGTMRPKSYSTIGLTKDKKKELSDMRVINPAITLLSMTTPDDLFKTIDVSTIKDGFLNRFIICVSEEERSIRKHKEPIEVPERIKEWVLAINERANRDIETAMDEPHIEKLAFSDEAIKMQLEFQQFCIDRANELDKLSLSEIPGRSNEMSMRLSLIHALSRDVNAQIIEKQDMEWSIGWIKYNLVYLIDKLKMSVSGSEYEGHKKEVLNAIRGKGAKGVTWSAMQKQSPFSNHQIKYLKDILLSLVDADLIIEEPYINGGRGRPTKIYKALA